MIVVKHQYFSKRDRQSRASGQLPKLAAVERAVAHVKYIQHRPGEDRADGGRELFDELEDRLDDKAVRKAIRAQEDNKVVAHKLTLAPEINPEDKRAFTREVMHQLGGDKGLDLVWFATEHNNTSHHHIHVVVLGKDRNGKDVRFTKEDYNRIKEYGDRHLERLHPYELEKSRQLRERKDRERAELREKEREAARQERIKEGLELPWMHRKIIREQLQPYIEWERQQQEKERALAGYKPSQTVNEREVPYPQDTIKAAGKEWSRANSLAELQELNQYLRDNYDERIPQDEYKKLVSWLRDKERQQDKERPSDQSDKGKPVGSQTRDQERTNKDCFTWKGESYSKNDSYEKLAGLAKELRENKKDRLPRDDYQRLRTWVEHCDRQRWSGAIDQKLSQAKQRSDHERKQNNSPAAGRTVDPLQQQAMANPVVGVFMSGASVINTVVSWIDLRDNRDMLKESREHLESAKQDKHQDYLKHDKPEDRAKDEESIDKLDRAIDSNKEARKKRDEEQKKKRDDRDRHDPFKYDPWGMY